MSKRICGICGEELKSTQEIKKHISNVHNIDFILYLKDFHFGKKVGYCLECGAMTNITIRGYNSFCSNSCQLKHLYKNETKEEKAVRIEKLKKAWTDEKKEKQSKIHVDLNKTYDDGYYAERFNKAKQTKLKKYGDENYGNYNSDKFKELMVEKYGVENIWKLEGYYYKYCSENIDKVRKTCLERYGKNWIFRDKFDINMSKRINYCLEKYGVEHYVYSEEYRLRAHLISEKGRNTKKRNGTINTSKLENNIYDELVALFPEFTILRNYSEIRYPYNCDFYIKEHDLFIEVQGFFTHGGKSFENTPEDTILLDKWVAKAPQSTFMKSAINIWTIKDVEKRNTALKNNLRFLELFSFTNIEKQIARVLNGLSSTQEIETIEKELVSIKNNKGSLARKPTSNKTIKHYQEKTLFKRENELYINNPVIRRKLIQNRIKFLNKNENELTDRELLSGFKISGIHRGYSFFSPFWFKFFIERYDVKKVYDPFGGWGHRLLGTIGTELEAYIYNDIDVNVKNSVENIYNDFNKYFNNCTFYSCDSLNFELNEEIDSIFMCPPYDTVEIYSHKNNDFHTLMEKMCELYLKKAQTLGIIIREDFYSIFENKLGPCRELFDINTNSDHFKTKTKKEKLYIWQK